MDYEPLLLLNERKNAIFHELGITMPPQRKMVLMDGHGVLSVGKTLPHPNIRLAWAPITLGRLLRFSASDAVRKEKDRLLDAFNALDKTSVSSLDNQALYDHVTHAVDLAMQWTSLRFRAYVFPMVLTGFRFGRLLSKAKSPGQVITPYDFLAGLDYKTAEIEHALYRLAEQLDSMPAARRLFLGGNPEDIGTMLERDPEYHAAYGSVAGFLREYGARTMKAYTPFSAESWAERPALLFSALTSILKAGGVHKTLEQQRNGAGRFIDLKDKMNRQLPKTKRKRFDRLLGQFRSAHMGREELVFRMEQCYVVARRGVAEAAQRLHGRGVLAEPDDIRYLTLHELGRVMADAPDSRALLESAATRKAHRFLAERAWNTPLKEGEGDRSDMLHGLSASPGIIKGPVRIIRGPDEFNLLQKGEVLVCRFTDPVWTPLFSVACAVVCDTGGPLSHAAIVAREYGMPAVLGVGNATAMLANGDEATVDGGRGTIKIRRPSR